ncbi:MAG TPA: hypothetical protein VH165_19180 [Kofleriaceae bacterium]|nr:hypothetical protein [Kofleriaceae bacterium]
MIAACGGTGAPSASGPPGAAGPAGLRVATDRGPVTSWRSRRVARAVAAHGVRVYLYGLPVRVTHTLDGW